MNVQSSIEETLRNGFAPSHLSVINESHMHNVPPGSESHFKLVVVSREFEGKRKVARHQMVYQQLDVYLAGGVHALAMHTYTPEEWQLRQQQAPDSPDCMGGSQR